MNMHTRDIALQRSLADVVAEYETKRTSLQTAIETFEAAGAAMKMAATIGGTYGDVTIDVGHVYHRDLELCLLKSAWKHVYDGLNINQLSSPTDKNLWKQALEKPAAFTLDNISGTFGKFIADPRGNILRGLAEVFCSLDPAFKSHDNMKIGVKGLPKRVILSNVGSYGSYGREKLQSLLNAIAVYQGKPMIEYRELEALLKDENALLVNGELPPDRTWDAPHKIIARGVRLRRFDNGNGHLFFEPDTLVDINKALAEFYGDVLPDTPDETPTKRRSTAISKDLQYYPTPVKVVEDVLDRYFGNVEGERILEPSCGCGRFMDALRKRKALAFGIEVDPVRAAQTRARGHSVLTANFLETTPNPIYDRVVMNPPFYGTHYAQHVRHAFEFMKPGGTLIAILPVTARDHGLLDDLGKRSRWDGPWWDLPVGSFSESGTNINTTILTINK